ncbi:MAG: hypothetical protein RR552_01440 [Oscillospiraceae bacterium]
MRKQKKTEVRILSKYENLDKVLSILIDNNFEIKSVENSKNPFDFKRMEGENPYIKVIEHLKSVAKYANWTYTNSYTQKALPEDFAEVSDEIYKKYKLLKMNKQMLLSQKEQCIDGKERFKLFGDLPVDFQEIAECEFIEVRFGHMPKSCASKLNSVYADDHYIEFFITYETPLDYWGMYFAPKNIAQRIDSIFASLLFEPIIIPSASGSALDVGAKIDESIAIINAQLEKEQAVEDSFFKEHFDVANTIYSLVFRELKKFEIKSNSLENGSSFIINGNLNDKNINEITKLIEKDAGAFIVQLKTFKGKSA